MLRFNRLLKISINIHNDAKDDCKDDEEDNKYGKEQKGSSKHLSRV